MTIRYETLTSNLIDNASQGILVRLAITAPVASPPAGPASHQPHPPAISRSQSHPPNSIYLSATLNRYLSTSNFSLIDTLKGRIIVFCKSLHKGILNIWLRNKYHPLFLLSYITVTIVIIVFIPFDEACKYGGLILVNQNYSDKISIISAVIDLSPALLPFISTVRFGLKSPGSTFSSPLIIFVFDKSPT